MFKAILVPIDLNAVPASAHQVETAVGLARSNGAQLHLLTVVPDFGMSIVGSSFPANYEAQADQEARKRLEAFARSEIPADVPATIHIAHGSVYRQILAAADANAVDLIVLSAHRPELKDYLLGPNVARVVRHATQSVFVVREESA
ncbi:MAG: universal stress protein [Pseudomonadota bacterium]